MPRFFFLFVFTVGSRVRESSNDESITSATSSTDSFIQRHNRTRRDSGDLSIDSCSQNSLSFHNYSKRYEDNEDDKNSEIQRYIFVFGFYICYVKKLIFNFCFFPLVFSLL